MPDDPEEDADGLIAAWLAPYRAYLVCTDRVERSGLAAAIIEYHEANCDCFCRVFYLNARDVRAENVDGNLILAAEELGLSLTFEDWKAQYGREPDRLWGQGRL